MEVNDDFETTTKALLSWLSEVGISVNPKMTLVDLRSEGQGRGVVAGGDFEEDEVVFSIPRSAVLNVKTVFEGVAALSTDSISDLPSWLALTIVLLAEGVRNESKWAPYLAVLPRKLDSLVFWSDTELAELQASSVVNKIGKAGAEEMFSKHIVPLELDGCDGDMCHRVASIIMAYAFDIPEEDAPKEDNGNAENGEDDLVSDDGEDEKTILSMIPLADMLNADAHRNNARLCCENEELKLRTIKSISKGEEILNDYGQLPRSDLLRRYGYVTDNYATFDVAELSTQSIINAFTTADALWAANQSLAAFDQEQLKTRIELAEREGVYEESYDICHPAPNGPSIPDELLALVYLLLLDDENLVSISNSKTLLPSRSKLTTELVGKVLVILLHTKLLEYATTVEEDEILGQAGNLSHRGMMALQVRLGEKRVLRNAIQEATIMSGSNKRMRVVQCPRQNPEIQRGAGKRRPEEASNPKKKGRFR